MKQKGFTLIEIIIVMALLITVIGGVLELFISHNKIFSYQNALIKASGSARTTMNEISQDALQSYRIVGSQTVNGTSYTSGASTVIFQIPSFNASGTVISNTYDYAVFSLNGNTLNEDFQAGTGSVRPTVTKTLSTSVTAFNISYDNASWPLVKKVTVGLTTSEVSRTETITQRLVEQYKLRNY
ncbi:MAG: hypothetical protein NVSMB66_6100 [Candidatus Doudnabacteria bacterium]